MRGRRDRLGLATIDLLLIGAAVSMFLLGVMLLWLSPAWGGCYLRLLDVRFWPPWKFLGFCMMLTFSVVVIRFWPT